MSYDEDRLKRFATVILARLPGTRLRVYAGLVTFRNNTTNSCYPSIETLAALTGLSRRTVRYAVADLVAVGLIRRTWRGRGGNFYQFAIGAAHHFPDPAPVVKRPPEVQPPIPMAVPDLVDNLDKRGKKGANKGQVRAPLEAEKGQALAPPSELVSTYELVPPPVVGQSTHQRARDDGNDGGSENQTNDNDPLAAEVAESAERIAERVAARIGRGGVWPRHPRFRHRLGVWMAAGWTRDHLVNMFVEKTQLEAVKDPAAIVGSILAGDPPTAPYAPDHARPLAWHADRDAKRRAAEQRNDAENGTAAEPVRTGAITGRPVTGAGVLFELGTRLAPTRPPEDVLGPVEGFPSDTEILDALDDRDVLDMTNDDYAAAYAATGTD